jgi:hypothetical protein
MTYLGAYVYQLADMLLELRKTDRARGVRLVSIRCEYGLWIGNVVLAMNFESAFGGVECVYIPVLCFLLSQSDGQLGSLGVEASILNLNSYALHDYFPSTYVHSS